LTEAGQALYGECQPLLSGIQSAVDRVDQNASELTGTLRVNTTVDHAVMTLSPAIAQFALKHPDLHIDLRTNDRVVDLIGEGVDVAIRMGWLKDSSLRAVKLDDFQQYVVGSPDYIRKAGRPKHPEDLARYDWVTLTLLPAPLTWKFTSKTGDTKTVTVKSRLRVDSPGALRALLCQGLGFSVLDQYSVEGEVKAGRLRRVLEDWSLPRGGLYAVCPPGPHLSAKARAFIEFYREYIKKR
jgi:DNA-binding transcriptional LysR family regulator